MQPYGGPAGAEVTEAHPHRRMQAGDSSQWYWHLILLTEVQQGGDVLHLQENTESQFKISELGEEHRTL